MRQSRAIVAAWLGVGAVTLAALAAGCRYDPAGFADDSGDGLPDADVDGPDAMALPCELATALMCLDAETLQRCGELGPEKIVCPLGCEGATGSAECKGPKPSNGFDVGWLENATASLEVPNGARWVFDGNTGQIVDCGTGTSLRAAGTGLIAGVRFEIVPANGQALPIGVWSMTGLRVRGGGELLGIGQNAIGILAAGEVRIDDVVALGGGTGRCDLVTACTGGGPVSCPGPGGFSGGGPQLIGEGPGGGKGGQGSPATGIPESGGAGAGHANSGADGGGGGGAAGAQYGVPRLVPLIGGSGGGGGGSGVTPGGVGGGGGGALQVSSLTNIHLGGGGAFDVGGGGGAPGTGTDGVGGGGGGSAGAVLLEAPVLRLDGVVAANGGGGGGGNGPGGGNATPGSPGILSAERAPGGVGVHEGGDGGAGSLSRGLAGSPATIGADGAGGGGATVGRVTFRTIPGGLSQAGGAIVSPAATVLLDLLE